MKAAYKKWKIAGRPRGDNELFIERNITKKLLRASYRQALAERDYRLKQKIIESRKYDPRTFHKLVNNQRCKGVNFITDLNVGSSCYRGEDVLYGFRDHFEKLGQQGTNEQFDKDYHELVHLEYELVLNILSKSSVEPVSEEELNSAIRGLNVGKAPDVYNLAVENILYCGKDARSYLLAIVNHIFSTGLFPSSLKTGLVSPIYKNKGEANVSSNYRGITVLPVLAKVVEAVLRARISPHVVHAQNVAQRGFTRKASPLNSAFIVEELYRESRDNKSDLHLIFLDAKSAFDVVDHKHLMRRLYHIGVTDHHWALIDTFHKDSTSAVKWKGQLSSTFSVQQGVRQGGVLSTDLYKVYVNHLLDRLQCANTGARIGDVRCAASACADDICLCADTPTDAQELLNISAEYANMERYLLQPTKSVHVHVSNKRKKDYVPPFIMNSVDLPSVNKATHLGIIRTDSVINNQKENVEENLKKARRKSYSLFGSGYRGQSGLNVQSTVHLYRTHIVPVLLYGLEILLPPVSLLNKLELFQRKFLKEVLRLPDTTANTAVYMVTGLLPVEAQLHLRALAFLHGVCSQTDSSLEKRILHRQLQVKSIDSSSWFCDIQKIMWKYDLGAIEGIAENIPTRYRWKKQMHRAVSIYWTDHFNGTLHLHSTLVFLSDDRYVPGRVLPLCAPEYTSRESERLKVKLRLLTGTYVLQSTRRNFNQYDINPMCQLCEASNETPEHFVIVCSALSCVRQSVMVDIYEQWQYITGSDFQQLQGPVQARTIINSWPVLQEHLSSASCVEFYDFERHCGRLLFSLDRARQLILATKAKQLPSRTKHKHANKVRVS